MKNWNLSLLVKSSNFFGLLSPTLKYPFENVPIQQQSGCDVICLIRTDMSDSKYLGYSVRVDKGFLWDHWVAELGENWVRICSIFCNLNWIKHHSLLLSIMEQLKSPSSSHTLCLLEKVPSWSSKFCLLIPSKVLRHINHEILFFSRQKSLKKFVDQKDISPLEIIIDINSLGISVVG